LGIFSGAKYVAIMRSGKAEIRPTSKSLDPIAPATLPSSLEEEAPVPLLFTIKNTSGTSIIIEEAALGVLESKKGRFPLLRVNTGIWGEGCGTKAQQSRSEPTLILSNLGPGSANDVIVDFSFVSIKGRDYDSPPQLPPSFQHSFRFNRIRDC